MFYHVSRIGYLFRRYLADLANVFLPDLCLLCRARMNGDYRYVCANCWASLEVFPDRSTSPIRTLRGCLDRLWIGWNFDHRMRRIIHLFKYGSRPELAELLVQEWLKTLPNQQDLRQMDLIIPVPIHTARRRWRGFNQSERLAVCLGSHLKLPVVSEDVVRIVNTKSQTSLDRNERWKSVANAFQVLPENFLANKRVLIVDDLVTSGATLHALFVTLRAQGVAAISAAVLTSPQPADSQSQKSA